MYYKNMATGPHLPRRARKERDPVIGLLAEVVKASGGNLEPLESSRGDVVEAILNRRESSARLNLITRSASPVIERLLEIIALAKIRRQSGEWSKNTALIIRVPHLPRSIISWELPIDLLLGNNEQHSLFIAVCSEHGGTLLRLPGFSLSMEDVQIRATTSINTSMLDFPRNEFTRHALKILLAQQSPIQDQWWGRKPEKITTGGQLAQLVEASPSITYALINALEKSGWATKGYGREIHLLNLPAIIAWWLDQQKHQRRRLVPVRALYGQASPPTTVEILNFLRERINNDPGGTLWAISGWAACHMLQLGILLRPEEKPFSITIGSNVVSAVIKEWQLVECDPRDALFFIEPAARRSAALAGRVMREGIQVVDGWQAALDVACDPDRGIEQANAIAEALWPNHL